MGLKIASPSSSIPNFKATNGNVCNLSIYMEDGEKRTTANISNEETCFTDPMFKKKAEVTALMH